MNNNHDVIGSLGEALSSVSIATGGDSSDKSGGGGASSQVQAGYGAPGTALGSQPGSWTGLSTGSAPSSGISYNYNHQASAEGNAGGHDSIQNILYDSGIYEKEELTSHRRASTGGLATAGAVPIRPHTTGTGSARSTTPTDGPGRERKESIDLFLSQSPSKMLGEDAFQIMHRTISNPSLSKLYPNGQQQHVADTNQSSNNSINGAMAPATPGLASTAPSSRTGSPQTVRNSLASSTGNSPYNSVNGSSQGLYNPSNLQFSATGAPFSPGNGQQPQGSQLQRQSSQLSSQYSGSSNNVPGLVNDQNQVQQVQQFQQQQQQQYMPVTQSQQPAQQGQQQQQQAAPQVFYMAVPGPDGKQVLQPVQMVQMPGQAGTLMMPVAAANSNQGQGQNPMMVMQPAQVGNMSSGMNNGMYGQDSGGNQYNQYGSVQQQQGYGYQSKNNAMDSLGVGGGYQEPVGNMSLMSASSDPNMTGNLSMLYASPQRPPLRALLGNVRRLSRDQVGCRLLQQALDEDGPSAATAILNEGLTFWAEAMVDPFGNYLFQKILERITREERVTLVSSVSTRLVNASLNLHGTRSVQKIVEVCAVDEEEIESEDEQEQEEKAEENKKEDEDGAANKARSKKKKKKDTAAKILTDALKPSAARLCIDSHGNHAIQRILLKLPYQYTQFIFDAVAASVEDVARHRHGCCVIQRCLDSRHSAARTHLVARIVEKSLELMQDAYGNYVVQYVLDVCGDDEVHAICESVIGKVCILAIQKFSSNVMEKCLERCTDRVREEYLNELNDSDRLREMMMDPFGNYVVQRALSVSTHAQAIRLVETMKPHLSSQNGGGIRNTAGGRRILGKICRRFPNFVLEGETFEDYDLNQMLARGSSQHHNSHGGGGGRRGQQNQFGMQPHHGGPSPRHGRGGRGGRNNHQHHNTIPQYQPQQLQQQQPIGHHVNVQQSDMNVMPAYGANPYFFPGSM